MRTIRALVALSLMAGTLALLGASPASAAGCFGIVSVNYDSPGDDNFSNDSLNAETVKIKNSCAKSKKIKGMTLGDEDKVQIVFPARKLRKNKSITIHTGTGNDNKKNLYIGENNYVWNNSSDTAFLRKKSGALIGRCAWDEGDTSPVLC
jgi:lamin tail-like protein